MERSASINFSPDGRGAAPSAMDACHRDCHAAGLSMATESMSNSDSLPHTRSPILMAKLVDQAEEGESAQFARVFDNAAELFAILSCPVRLKIICELNRKPSRVTDLAQRIQSSQPNTSMHLRLLRQVGVVQKCRKSRYSIRNHQIATICEHACANQRN